MTGSNANDEAAATVPALDVTNLNTMQLDALREIGNIGAGTAASSLSLMTGEPIGMAVPRVSIMPVEEVGNYVGGEEQIVVAVYLQVIGDAPGHIVFVIPAETAHELCHQLMGGMQAGDPDPAAVLRVANPSVIPRNHRIEQMIEAATGGDYAPFERLNAVLSRPFDDHPDAADLTRPPRDHEVVHATFCGT